MPHVHLTEQVIAAHSYAGGTDYLWDTVRRGFGLRTYPSGRKAFVVSVAGVPRVVGDWPTFTVEEAWLAGRRRQQAAALAPFGLQGAGEPARTLADLHREHVAWMRAHRKPGAADDVDRRYRLVLLTAFGAARTLASLTAAELELWHQRQLHRKVLANRAMATLRAGWTHAERWGWVPPSSNPLRDFGRWKFDERPRRRVLSREEASTALERLHAFAADPRSRHRRPALGLLLMVYTGLRHQEAARLTADAVHLEAAVLVIEDHKTSRKNGPKVVALPRPTPDAPGTPDAVELMRTALQAMPAGERRVFGVRHFYRTWRKVRPADDVTPHDLRRTIATRLDEAGEELHRIGRLLGQRDVRVTRDVYTHPSLQSLRDVACRGARLMVNH